MTENEAIELLNEVIFQGEFAITEQGCKMKVAFDVAIKALEEIQEFRKLGTVEDVPRLLVEHNVIHEYTNIGTVRECKIAVERLRGGA